MMIINVSSSISNVSVMVLAIFFTLSSTTIFHGDGSIMAAADKLMVHTSRRNALSHDKDEQEILVLGGRQDVNNAKRVLKKKSKKKRPKAPKKPKSKSPKASGKGMVATESPTSQPSGKPSGKPSDQPTVTPDPCDGNSEKDALLDLKKGLTDVDSELIDWDSTTDPCTGSTSNWGTAIDCSADGKLLQLNIEEMNLSGKISPLLGCLSSLTDIYLNGNSLSGTIPSELGKLTNLTYLDFENNAFSGTIPSDLGNLTNLTGLMFEDNNLSGTMPSQICANRDDAVPTGGLLTSLTADCSAPTIEVTCVCCTSCPL